MAVREKKWMLLAEDGRHVWLGRHSDPSSAELDASEARLRGMGLGGWLAVHEGDYWDGGPVVVMMVRPLASPVRSWDGALAAFEAERKAGLAS